MTGFWMVTPFVREGLLASLDILVKATLLILLALALNAALRGRQRVLTRSVMFNSLLAALVLLPAATLAFPRLRVPCLPAIAEPATPAAAPTNLSPPPPESATAISSPDQASAPHSRRAWTPTRHAPNERPFAGSSSETEAANLTSTSETAAITSPPPAASTPARWPWYALSIYLAGAALMTARLLISLSAVRRLRHAGRPLTDPEWIAALDRWRDRLGITACVELRISPTVTFPLACGWLKPAVIIPETLVATLDARQRETVLLHELAHIRRHDYAWQLLLKLVQSVYWLHPLVWVIGGCISAVREQACDDLCAYHAATPQEYRATLIEIAARLVRRPAIALGIAMASTPKIARRLERIDAAHRCARCVAGRPARVIATALALAAAAIIGPIQLDRRAAAAPAAPVVTTATPPATQPASTGQPKLRIADPVYNFPDTWAGDIVEHTWTLYNDGDAPLEINPQSTCGCTVVGDYDKVIPPHGQGKITVKFNTRGYNGDVTKTITIRTNDPTQVPPPSVHPKGKVLQRISVDPPQGAQFTRNALAPNAPLADRERTITITNNTDQLMKCEPASMHSPTPFKYEIQEVASGKVYQVIVTLDKALLHASTANFFPLRFKTGLAEPPEITVNVFIPQAIELSTQSLAVATPINARFHREINLTHQGPMQITGYSATDPAIKLDAKPVGNGETWFLFVDIPVGWDPIVPLPAPGQPLQSSISITVKTNVPEKPELTIRVFTYPQALRTTTTQPANNSPAPMPTTRLGFAILPTLDQAVAEDRPTDEQIITLITDLRTNGPDPGHRRKDEYQWFEATCKLPDNVITAQHAGLNYVLLHTHADKALMPKQGLGTIRLENATAKQIIQGEPKPPANRPPIGHILPVINLKFDPQTGAAFGKLTKENLNKPLAALVDDRVVMQATIRSEIGAQVEINGNFTEEEAQELVTELSAGLPPPTHAPATRPARAGHPDK